MDAKVARRTIVTIEEHELHDILRLCVYGSRCRDKRAKDAAVKLGLQLATATGINLEEVVKVVDQK